MKQRNAIAGFLSLVLTCTLSDAVAGSVSRCGMLEKDDTLKTSLEGMSAIYRAKLAKQYPMRYNGTPYWDTCGFQKGEVIFNGRLYEDMLVNLDASEGEVSVKFSDQVVAVSPDRSQVPYFTRGGKQFINLEYLGIEGAREGFYQLLYDEDSEKRAEKRAAKRSRAADTRSPEQIKADRNHRRNQKRRYKRKASRKPTRPTNNGAQE